MGKEMQGENPRDGCVSRTSLTLLEEGGRVRTGGGAFGSWKREGRGPSPKASRRDAAQPTS